MRHAFRWTAACILVTALGYGPAAVGQKRYDARLAARLGADEYGMKHYVMAFLKAGHNRSQDSVEASAIQSAHLKNIMRLAGEGKLLVAGSFLDDQELKGIFIFNTGSLEEARALAETDPAVRAGRLVLEPKAWYGSAALQEVNRIHGTIVKKSVAG